MNSEKYGILLKFNILFLEDDENLLKHTKDVLEDFVHNVYAVKTSKEALEVVRKNKVDVIVSDILLKDENSIDFLKYLKDKNIHIPTILTTAHTDTNYLLDAIKLKVENYIIKPINIEELLENLYDILLPKIQQKQIKTNIHIIKTISSIIDNKQVDIIKHIINNLNNENLFIASLDDICEQFKISKPTVIKLFKDLSNKEILIKVRHKTYRFNENALESTI